jgi:hypothetical protein
MMDDEGGCERSYDADALVDAYERQHETWDEIVVLDPLWS